MIVSPITQREALAFVREHHRHHKPPRGSLYQLAVSEGDTVVGVCIVGRPVARMLDDGWTAEVTRCCTDGSRNACSMLYSAAWRAARALGYRRLVTYTLPAEGGASLRGAGWRCIGEAGGGSWSRRSRPRVDHTPRKGNCYGKQHDGRPPGRREGGVGWRVGEARSSGSGRRRMATRRGRDRSITRRSRSPTTAAS